MENRAEKAIDWVVNEATNPNRAIEKAITERKAGRTNAAVGIQDARKLVKEASDRLHAAVNALAEAKLYPGLVKRIDDIGDKISTADIEMDKVLDVISRFH